MNEVDVQYIYGNLDRIVRDNQYDALEILDAIKPYTTFREQRSLCLCMMLRGYIVDCSEYVDDEDS